MTLSIEQFCDQHKACKEGREWALSNCKDMEEVWQTAKLEWLIWIATREGVLTDKELRLFAVWCARQVQHLMTDERSINALDVAERHANGCETDEELTAAGGAAWAAAAYAALAAAAAIKERQAAVRNADSAAYAALAAAAAIKERQAAWLRANCKPNFVVIGNIYDKKKC